MPTFITTGSFTNDAIKGLMAKPEDRTAAVAAIVEAAGGKLHHYYLTTGDNDFLIITEADDAEQTLAAVAVAAASGAVTNIQTQRAWTSGEFASVMAHAGKIASAYAAPGS